MRPFHRHRWWYFETGTELFGRVEHRYCPACKRVEVRYLGSGDWYEEPKKYTYHPGAGFDPPHYVSGGYAEDVLAAMAQADEAYRNG